MDALGGGNGGIWGLRPFHKSQQGGGRRDRGGRGRGRSSSSKPPDATGGAAFQFPIKQAATAASLALTGDTLAQLRERWVNSSPLTRKTPADAPNSQHTPPEDVLKTLLSNHNWLRALRMTSYGFLLYGPGSYAWYQFLDRCMPKQTIQNVLTKVLLNQVVLGPCVIAVVFAWNNLWQGKLSELPKKYQDDALRTLLFGFRFWIPVSVLNFCVPGVVKFHFRRVVPLQARVAFMSMGSIFWNFCLSSTMSK